MKNLIIKNYHYFKINILPYYILIHTNQGVILVDSSKANLLHLLGIHKTGNFKYKRMKPIELWNYLDTGHNISLFDLIDKNRFESDTLSTDELFLYRRNKGFIPIFESLFNQINLNFYLKKFGNDFDADYIQFCYYNRMGGYLGIIGSDKNNYHYFNSIMLEYDNPEKYIGPKVIVKKVEKILKSEFVYTNYRIVSSKRFAKKQRTNTISNSTKPNINISSNKCRNKINQLLKYDLKIEKGENGKKSIKITKNKTVLEKGIRLNFKSLDTYEKIANFINKTYSSKNKL